MKAFPAQIFAVRNGGGGVSGPSSSVDNAAVRSDGTTGAIQGSAVRISDEASNTVTINLDGSVDDTNLVLASEGAGYLEVRVPGASTIYFSTSGSTRWSIDNGGLMVAQSATSALQVQGAAKLKGLVSTADVPNTTDFPADNWGFHKHTGTGVLTFVYNDGGTLKGLTLLGL